ncbi:MAG: hypothetical protein FJ276_04735 [Planctomycetes bacterium]|nr:hypothetical protein [Planctomycetota bacterium]
MIRLTSLIVMILATSALRAGTKTWDGKYDTEKIKVTVVYFVPADHQPLPDWRDRVAYYCRRVELFHAREFQGQSTLTTSIHEEPLVSDLTTAELRQGDANAIYFRTLQEADRRLKFAVAEAERDAFPILLVMSDINWRPLDDFYRVIPREDGFAFEGNYQNGQHFPGAAAGGARASYLADRGVGWALVSADGWRVPYRGSDCVAYHEGCGHTVGLPHPEPGNNSVMSMGQYHGWLNESWLDEDQKTRLGWQRQDKAASQDIVLFSHFRALPQPVVPRPGEPVTLALEWPTDAKVASLCVRFQTSLAGPWIDVPQHWEGDAPQTATLATFERETPVSYRIDARLKNGASSELWGYFQVRGSADQPPQPFDASPDLFARAAVPDGLGDATVPSAEELDLLALADPDTCWTSGRWSKEAGKLVSPKQYGARIELPHSPPEEYRLTVVVEPLDEPDGLILGQSCGGSRFAVLLNYTPATDGLSALENIDGRNVGNETTLVASLFRKDRLSQAIVTVRKCGVTVTVDGRTIISWKGTPDRLSLSDYWNTPNSAALFLGAYDCRYRFHRVTLEEIPGTTK